MQQLKPVSIDKPVIIVNKYIRSIMPYILYTVIKCSLVHTNVFSDDKMLRSKIKRTPYTSRITAIKHNAEIE